MAPSSTVILPLPRPTVVVVEPADVAAVPSKPFRFLDDHRETCDRHGAREECRGDHAGGSPVAVALADR